MVSHFKFIIVGRGMMGAAAARHLALQSDGVALIGPDEPHDKKSHAGVFASHYDEGRITRSIDPDPEWALLAHRSIGRYAQIERDSGIGFYTQSGCLIVGPKRGGADAYVADVCTAAAKVGAVTDVLDDAGLAERFSYFAFEAGSEGVHEPRNAGFISPRKLVAAQSLLAEKAGATVIRQVVTQVDGKGDVAVVTTADGRRYTADKVLVAAGGFSIAENLLPEPVDLTVYARTVVFFEVDEIEAQRLSAMPTLISKPAHAGDSIYMLPAIRYPDGRHYLKIGGDPDDLVLNTDAEIRDWFRTDGRAAIRDHLTRIMGTLVPDLRVRAITSGSCVTSFTPTDYPAIGYSSSPCVAVLTGGCGAAAKSSDEIGRLGAELLLRGAIDDPAYGVDFTAHFR